MTENNSKQEKGIDAEQESQIMSSNTKEEESVAESVQDNNKFRNRAVFFSAINLVAVITLFFIISELPKEARNLSSLINSQLRAEMSSRVNYSDLQLQSNRERSDYILALFPDDSGLVDFIQTVERLKSEGAVVNFSFASSQPVRDKTGGLGIPVLIEIRGTWEAINNDLVKLQRAPYLFRPITVDIRNTDEEEIKLLLYGGFLYVDESFE